MNIGKAKRLVEDNTGKSDFKYYVDLTKKVQEILNCVEAVPGRRSLHIMCNSGDTYTYTWNSCSHCFDCEYVHKNRSQFGKITKAEAVTDIATDLYNQAEWKLI